MKDDNVNNVCAPQFYLAFFLQNKCTGYLRKYGSSATCCMLHIYMYLFMHMYFYFSDPDFADNDILDGLEGRVHK